MNGTRRESAERAAGNPRQEDLAVLILIDEVLMYARDKIGHDPAWRDG